MSFIGAMGAGYGPGSGLRFSSGRTRGRIEGGALTGVNYPSPFFDIAHTYLPVTVKQLFRWCRYYFLTNPLINATVFKMSEYPITDVVIDHESPEVRNRWKEYLNDGLRINSLRVESGLDYFCYGNSTLSVGFPFKKFLYCRSCKFKNEAEKIRAHWVFTNYNFRLKCPACGNIGDADARDFYYKNANGIRAIRWNPEDIDISYNDLTGEYTYYYTIPGNVRNDVVLGRKEIIESIPQTFIQAMREQKGVIFSKENFFHLRRPTLANQDRGWGIPLLLPVLKDTFYLQIMKKAQEAILLEHIVPLRVLFPQPSTGTSDPYTSVNLVDWRDQIATEIARWRHDHNYIPILPLPVGHQSIGGDGKALMLTQEMQAWSEQIIIGMGVPREFLFGGMSYAGTNVSMRMLENAFIGYVNRQRAMVRFLVKMVANYLDWPEVSVRFKPFKMADDIQRKSLLFQYNQAGKISDTTMLADSDFDVVEENEIMKRETDGRIEATKKQQLAVAQMQADVQVIMMKAQAKAQQAMAEAMAAPAAPGEPGGPDAALAGDPAAALAAGAAAPLPQLPLQGGKAPNDWLSSTSSQLAGSQRMAPGGLNVDLPSYAAAQAQTIAQMPPDYQAMAINAIRTQSPELADLVVQNLAALGVKVQGGAGGQQQGGPQVDMRPMPQVLPERRAQKNV